MCRLKQKRNALCVILVGSILVGSILVGSILVGSILAALICSECFILNTTASVPSGLWLKLDTLPKKGDFVLVPIDAFSSTECVPPEYFRKNMWGQTQAGSFLSWLYDLLLGKTYEARITGSIEGRIDLTGVKADVVKAKPPVPKLGEVLEEIIVNVPIPAGYFIANFGLRNINEIKNEAGCARRIYFFN